MKCLELSRYTLTIGAAAAILAGCGGGTAPIAPSAPVQQAVRHGGAASPIQNVIVVIQQDRSFDDLFAGYPGANAPTKGLTSNGKYLSLRPMSLEKTPRCTSDLFGGFKVAYDGGKMDGWNLLDSKAPLCPYTRVERGEVRPYWDLAKRFALADEMFSSTHFGDFANSIYLVAGTTKLARRTYAVGPPTREPWGCDAPPGTQTPILKNGRVDGLGPFPCFDQFPSVANLLDTANVSWRFYDGGKQNDGIPFNAFDALKHVREGKDWQRDMSTPASKVLSDIANGKLASVSWVLSPLADSDFLGSGGGPKWVNSIVAATQKSSYWKRAAVVVIWTNPENGNFYDNVPPPQLDPMGLGFRVPMIVVSPYAKHGYVSHTEYEFGSILKFIEENWDLGSLGATDVRANSIGDVFSFSR